LVVWNVVGPQGPAGPPGPAGAQGPAGPQGPAGGVLAVSEYACGASLPLEPGAPVMFYSPSGINVGSGISIAGQLFSSIVLQSGLYQIHWVYGWGWGEIPISTNGVTFEPTHPDPQPTLNGSSPPWAIGPPYGNYFPDRLGFPGSLRLGGGLVRVSQPNSVLQFVNKGDGAQTGYCEVIITRLQ
jgi:hypothetical protein